MSAVKKKEKGDLIVIRVYNITSESSDTIIEFNLPVKEMYIINLKEERILPIIVNNNKSEKITIKPKEIVTFEIM